MERRKSLAEGNSQRIRKQKALMVSEFDSPHPAHLQVTQLSTSRSTKRSNGEKIKSGSSISGSGDTDHQGGRK